jgi:hypothetical protein
MSLSITLIYYSVTNLGTTGKLTEPGKTNFIYDNNCYHATRKQMPRLFERKK